MNTTANGSSSWSCSSLINPEALKVGETVAFSLILVVSLVGNFLIVLIVYKTPTLRKPINMLIANMAMSDLLYPIFMFPVQLADLHVGSWLIGGTLGQALCKIHPFLTEISMVVSIQSLVLITVDRYAAVVVPLRSPLISRKVCRCLIVSTWILAVPFCWPYLFTYNLVEYQDGKWCMNQVEVIFGEKAHLVFTSYQLVSCSFTSLLSSWWYFTPSSWSSLKSKSIQVNSQPALRNRGQEQTEKCLRWPLLSL